MDMWVYKGEGNHTATREFLSRVVFQKNLSNVSSALPVSAPLCPAAREIPALGL